MVDSVNSSLVNAQALRAAVEQSSVPAPQQPASVSVPPSAPFIDRIVVDFEFDTAVIQIRDRETGDVSGQFPSESRLAAQSRAQASRERAQALSGQAQEQQAASEPRPNDIITVQEVTSTASANAPIPSPQIAVAALSSAAQSGQPAPSGNVSVQA